jgi:hypothetical protein
MTQTKILNQLKALETLYSEGTASPTVETAIQDIIDRELETALTQHQTLSQDLQHFEQQYQLSSPEFHQRFHTGDLGDDIDMIEWNACYEIWRSLEVTIALLRQSLEA